MQNGHRAKEPPYTVLAGGILAAGGGLLALGVFTFGSYLTYGNVSLTGWHMVTVAKQIADAGNDGSGPYLWWWGVFGCAVIVSGLGLALLGLALVSRGPASDDREKSDLPGRYLAAGVILFAAIGVVPLFLPEIRLWQFDDWNSMVLAHYSLDSGFGWTLVGLGVAGLGGVWALIGLQEPKEPPQVTPGPKPKSEQPTRDGEQRPSPPSKPPVPVTPQPVSPAPAQPAPTQPAPTAPGAGTVKVEAEGGVSVVNIGGKMTVEAPAPGTSGPPNDRPKPPPLRLVAAGRTDVGREHERRGEKNEDDCYVNVANYPDRATGLFIVADGLGGHPDGAVASGLAVMTIRDALQPLLAPGSTQPSNPDYSDRLREAVKQSDAVIWQYGSKRPGWSGRTAASTVTVALVVGDKAYIANVGDSRTYHLCAGKFTLITQDDVDVASGRLTRALGDGKAAPDPFPQPLQAGDALLLCSDGLYKNVSDPELVDILTKVYDPNQACKVLIERAKNCGGTDDITAVVVRCEKAQGGQR